MNRDPRSREQKPIPKPPKIHKEIVQGESVGVGDPSPERKRAIAAEEARKRWGPPPK